MAVGEQARSKALGGVVVGGGTLGVPPAPEWGYTCDPTACNSGMASAALGCSRRQGHTTWLGLPSPSCEDPAALGSQELRGRGAGPELSCPAPARATSLPCSVGMSWELGRAPPSVLEAESLASAPSRLLGGQA